MSDELLFSVCLPRQDRQSGWVLYLLRGLWERGWYYNDVPDWEGQLAAPASLTTESGEYKEPLRACARLIVENQQGGLLQAFNGVSPVGIDMTLNENPHFTWISLSVGGSYAAPGKAKGELRPPYMETYQAFIASCKILCEVAQPLFGFGYSQSSVTDMNAPENFVCSGGEALLEGQLPEIDHWFRVPPLRFLASGLLTPALLLDLLEKTRWQVERLSNGGVFVAPLNAAYSYEANSAHLYLSRGEEKRRSLEQMLAGKTPKADRLVIQQLLQEGNADMQRARSIFETIAERSGIQKTITALDTLAYDGNKLLGEQP